MLLNRSITQRPGGETQLLVQTLSPASRSPLMTLVRRIADTGCNLADTRVSTLGSDVCVILLAQGSWDAVAKLETALDKLSREDQLHLVHYRTQARAAQTHLLPYLVEVIAADRTGVLAEVIEFFTRNGISIEQLTSMRYQAMQTGAGMFQAQITIGIPSESHIATLRDDFLELCDRLNLDAIMDPVKF
ncbi:MAG: transcriptional regulator [Oleiagrimonas sp.]|nr:ACT domain-containing protein [Oleiagrimonas sp.]MDA3913315.1 transcriptional regulator [Oleiagrimonas sp.]